MRRGLVVLIVVLAAVSLCAYSIIAHTVSQAHIVRCASNLSRLRMAIENYIVVHGRYPPAYTMDEHGNRLLSWRVLILPYLGGK